MLYVLLDRTRDWLNAHGVYRYVSVLDQVQFRALAASLLAFVIVVLLGPRVIAALVRLKIGDSGLSDAEALRRHTASKANTPTMGGILIVAAIAGSVALLADVREFFVILGLIVLLWLAVVGGVDDWLKLTAKSRGAASRQGLYAWEKLVFQLGLGLLVGYFLYKHVGTAGEGGGVMNHVLNLPFQKTYVSATRENPSLIYLPMGVFVVVAMLMVAGMSNAVNITDGMDGLATGVAGIVAIGLVVLALVAGDQANAAYLRVPHIEDAGELAVFAGATAGACFGFLWWNCSPAQVFMGDTGALSLGGVVGYIALVTRQEAVVLVMCGIFLWEIASVAMQVGYFKATKGRRIFRVAPYHHHLHLGGWTEQQVVARAWIVSVLLVVVALASIKVR